MWRDIVGKVESIRIRADDRTNTALCSVTVAAIILYAAVGIVQFSQGSPNAVQFITAYVIWIALGVLILLRYRQRPNMAIGLYMLIIGTDRIISWILGLYDDDSQFAIVLEIVLSIWMFISGVMWIMDATIFRIPLIITSIVYMIIEADELGVAVECFQSYGIDDISMFLDAVTMVLRYLMHPLLIALLLCYGRDR